jgi:hypothetical protein
MEVELVMEDGEKVGRKEGRGGQPHMIREMVRVENSTESSQLENLFS